LITLDSRLVGIMWHKPVLTYAITLYIDFDGFDEFCECDWHLMSQCSFVNLMRNEDLPRHFVLPHQNGMFVCVQSFSLY